MDILTALNRNGNYSSTQLQFIIGAWVVSTLSNGKKKISTSDGNVAEGDYDKRSIYALLYALYRSMGDVKSEKGETYEMTFNTWGYAWPASWGPDPIPLNDPQRFGKSAYTGLFQFAEIKEYVRAHEGHVHLVEMGCGTGAGANLICETVLPECTYEAVDMQRAAIATCNRKFVPRHGGRLVATWADATELSAKAGIADIVVVCETHVTEMPGEATEEDRRFFQTAFNLLKPGGYLVWGNAIPESTWKPCFDVLGQVGLKVLEVRDVTKEAVVARDEDKRRVDAFVEECLSSYVGFRIPVIGKQKRLEAELAMKNFYRHPGTNLYQNMVDGTDTYKVVLAQKSAS